MLKNLFRLSCLIVGLGFSFSCLYAGQFGPPVSFQADYVQIIDNEEHTGKYSAGPEGIRMEGEMDGEEHLVIINFSRGLTWVVMEEEKVYYEMPLGPDAHEDFARVCPELTQEETMVGTETVNGRNVQKWHCEKWDGSVDKVWYDTRLRMPVKAEENGDVFELRNIEETDLPADTFKVPEGYERITIPGMEFNGSFFDSGEQEENFFGGAFKDMIPNEAMDDKGEGLLDNFREIFNR